MKNKLINTCCIFCSIIALSLLLTACKENRDSRPSFTIAFSQDLEPFDYLENGIPRGIDIEIIQAISEDQGFDITLIPASFTEVLVGVEESRYDAGLGMISYTEWRTDTFDYTSSYYYTGIGMGVKNDNISITGYGDLSEKTVSCLNGSTNENFIEYTLIPEYGVARCISCDSIDDAYDAVTNGTADAIIDDYPILLYHQAKGVPLKVVCKPEEEEPMGMIVKKGYQMELRLMFNLGLQNIRENGTLDAIISSYLGTTAQE